MIRLICFYFLVSLQVCAILASSSDRTKRQRKAHYNTARAPPKPAKVSLSDAIKLGDTEANTAHSKPAEVSLSDAIELGDIEAIKKAIILSLRTSLDDFNEQPTICPWYLLICSKKLSVIREVLAMESYEDNMLILECCLLSAIMCDFDEIVPYLASSLLKIQGFSSIGNTLEIAFKNRHYVAFGTIIGLEAFDPKSIPLESFMLRAVAADNQLLVAVMLNSGRIQVDAPLDLELNTALHSVTTKPLALFLLQCGASKTILNSLAQTPAERARIFKNHSIYFLLEEPIDRVLQMKAMFVYPPFSILLEDIDRSDLNIFEICSDRLLQEHVWKFDLAECIVSFRDEVASDAGGPYNHWMSLMLSRLSESTKGSNALFTCQPDLPGDIFAPNQSFASFVDFPPRTVSLYKFAGILVAKALKQGIPLHMCFLPSVYKRLLGHKELSFKDLLDDEPALYHSMNNLGANKDSIDSAQLFFLNQPEKAVTAENFDAYLEEFWKHRLNGCGKKSELDAFIEGFHNVFPPECNALSGFVSWEELREVMYGDAQNLTASDFKEFSVVMGVPDDNEEIVSWFWEVVADYTDERRLELFTFLTGLPFVPYGGLQMLTPTINLHFCSGKPEMTSSTCGNSLFIPMGLRSKEELKAAMDRVLENKLHWGFDEALDAGMMLSLEFNDRNTNRLLSIDNLLEERKRKQKQSN